MNRTPEDIEAYPYSELDMDMHIEAVTKDLKAEIEQLRAALRSIVDEPQSWKMRRTAREALNIQKEPT